MKIFTLLLSILALVSLAFSLKNEAICGLQHSKSGNGLLFCHALFKFWSYKAATNECVRFTYAGCGGNSNRFGTRNECERMCKT